MITTEARSKAFVFAPRCGSAFVVRQQIVESFAAMKMAEAFVENTGVTSKEPFSCTVVSRRIMKSALGMTGKGHSLPMESQGCATFNIDRLLLLC